MTIWKFHIYISMYMRIERHLMATHKEINIIYIFIISNIVYYIHSAYGLMPISLIKKAKIINYAN